MALLDDNPGVTPSALVVVSTARFGHPIPGPGTESIGCPMKTRPVSDLEPKFPLCARYVHNFLANPNVFAVKYPQVWDAFLKACTAELSSAETRKATQKAREALTMDQGP